jgi:iron(III) transport system ATP-binding protein
MARPSERVRRPHLATQSAREYPPVATLADSARALRLVDISHAFDGKTVVREVSLTLRKNEIACLLGPSGCGKTTLLRLAAGLEPLQKGRVEIGGRRVADAATGLDLQPHTRRVGLMFQDYALFPHLTVSQNVRFGVAGTAESEAWTHAALARTGLSAWADAYPHTLSGGQQQRCALLRALAPHPEILLLDEPFSGLDADMRAQVREETIAFLRETGITTLIVTHDSEEAMISADRLLVMRDGMIIQQGAPADVYFSPREPFVAGLFGPLNRWVGRVTEGRVYTPLGVFQADGLADGSEAIVLIRPQHIGIDPQGEGATVLDSRLTGSSSAVTLVTDAWDGQLRALVVGNFLPAPGTRVGVAADPAAAFVFAVRSESDGPILVT